MRICEYCAGEISPSKPRNTRYCSPECRRNNSGDADRQPNREPDTVVTHLPTAPTAPAGNPLVERVRGELEAAGRLDTVLGQQALAVAEAMSEARGTAAAALSKELRTVVAEAMKGVNAEVDPIDELKLRRDRKLG